MQFRMLRSVTAHSCKATLSVKPSFITSKCKHVTTALYSLCTVHKLSVLQNHRSKNTIACYDLGTVSLLITESALSLPRIWLVRLSAMYWWSNRPKGCCTGMKGSLLL